MAIRLLHRHQRVTIMGLGLFGGGVGAARFWRELGSEVTVTDLRSAETLAPSLAQIADLGCRLVLGEHREEDFKGRDLVVVNPAVKPDNKYVRLARSAGADIVTEVGLVFRLARSPVLGVTGSNGKSTTTAILGAMLAQHDPRTLVGGNLGGSLLPAMKEHVPSAPIVLELSSFQLHYLKPQATSPAIAVITNLSPNHLDWHGTVLRYYEDKRLILRFQTADDTAVLNAEDPTLAAWAEACAARVISVARTDPQTPHACFLRGESAIVMRLDGEETALGPIAALRIPGRHNVINALLAAAAAFAYSRDPRAIRQGLAGFQGLPHRLEHVGTVDGVRFINDSIATTPESAICALDAFAGPKVIIAGGYDKGIPMDAFGSAIREKAHAVILVGQMSAALRGAIEAQASDRPLLPILDAGVDFESAVRLAKEACPAGGTVLLSPACASYDMFTNFEERGDRFRALVQGMGPRPPA